MEVANCGTEQFSYYYLGGIGRRVVDYTSARRSRDRLPNTGKKMV
jgi:hypothetical protein